VSSGIGSAWLLLWNIASQRLRQPVQLIVSETLFCADLLFSVGRTVAVVRCAKRGLCVFIGHLGQRARSAVTGLVQRGCVEFWLQPIAEGR
jgi:hypothetical protein